jgi:hypothetical protein
MPRYIEVIKGEGGLGWKEVAETAIPTHVKSGPAFRCCDPLETSGQDIEITIVQKSHNIFHRGYRVVWKISDDKHLAELWHWPASAYPANP